MSQLSQAIPGASFSRNSLGQLPCVTLKKVGTFSLIYRGTLHLRHKNFPKRLCAA